MGLPADPEGDGDDGTVYKGSSGRSGRGNKAGGENDEEMEDDSGDDDDNDDDDSEEEDAEEYEGDDQMAVVTIQDDFEDELMGLKKKKKTSEAAPEPIPFLPPSSRKQTKKRLAQAKLPQAKKLISTLAPPEEKSNIKQISSDYRSFETKAERRKMREMEKARRKEKWDIAKERRGGSGGGRGGSSARGGRGSSRGGAGGGRGGATSARGKGGKKGSKKAQWGAI